MDEDTRSYEGSVAKGLRQVGELLEMPEGDDGAREFEIRLATLTTNELYQYTANIMAMVEYLEPIRDALKFELRTRKDA